MSELEGIGRVAMEAWAVRKLIGPTLDLVGRDVLPGMAERGIENFGRVLQNGYSKLGSKADEPGEVPPRVLRALLEEAPYAEDEIVVEYLGGVLASARTGVARDDRAASYMALITRLSVYDLRMHYIGYHCAHRLFAG